MCNDNLWKEVGRVGGVGVGGRGSWKSDFSTPNVQLKARTHARPQCREGRSRLERSGGRDEGGERRRHGPAGKFPRENDTLGKPDVKVAMFEARQQHLRWHASGTREYEHATLKKVEDTT